MNEELNYSILESILAPQTQALQQLAMRPQKSYAKTVSTPYALQDLIAARGNIGLSTKTLNDALKAREDAGYTIANALMAMPEQQGYGSWLGNAARVFGAGLAAPTNAQVDRAQKIHEAEMADLANRLAFDKAMGDTKVETIGYTEMPYGTKGGKDETIIEQKSYDISSPEMPKNKVGWGELELQSKRVDPEMNVRTAGGIVAKLLSDTINPESRYSMQANQNAYTNTFTVPKITQLAKQTGGSRGIDTIPEINIKGGPELSAETMDSGTFVRAVKDQAWQAADQIVKANPNARITREELANAFINNFNHGIEKKYRVVSKITAGSKPASEQPKATTTYDYSAYGF